VVITAASVQDRDAARPLLWNLHQACRHVRLVWADAGYATGKLATWATALKMTLRVVAKRDPHAFEILPRRWVVERTFAWISKHRRTVRDYEHLTASHEAMILWAMIALMARRLAQSSHLSNAHLVTECETGRARRARPTPSARRCLRGKPGCDRATRLRTGAVGGPWYRWTCLLCAAMPAAIG
jgi:transposase